jgi:hypothetical protein
MSDKWSVVRHRLEVARRFSNRFVMLYYMLMRHGKIY